MMNGFETAVETLVKTFSSSPWGALGFREILQTSIRLGFSPAFVSAQKRELDCGRTSGASRLTQSEPGALRSPKSRLWLVYNLLEVPFRAWEVQFHPERA